jgi:hypothetical protein
MKERGMKRESMVFYPGFDLWPTKEPFGFEYGQGVFVSDPGRCPELWEEFTP